jgi:DNA-binding NtrC family response regulator
VLEESRLRRVGGKVEIEVDARLLSATNRDLKTEIKNGRFREALYFRLNVFQIALPPLRERRDDVPILVQHFIEKFNSDSGKRVAGIHPDTLDVLKNYDWPGNIRELRNAVERAVILCDGELVQPEHLPPDLVGKAPERQSFKLPFGLPLDLVEKEYILASLQRNKGNKARTAEGLGVSEKTLYNKLNRYAAEALAARQAPETGTEGAQGAAGAR